MSRTTETILHYTSSSATQEHTDLLSSKVYSWNDESYREISNYASARFLEISFPCNDVIIEFEGKLTITYKDKN